MKQILFFLAMLISVATSAQSGITVKPISANYGNKTVTFTVSWLNSSRTGTHNSKVWVWVDFAPVTGNVVTGSWSRALVSGTPTASVGTPTRETGNDKGFWLQGTSGSSGTYNATVMVSLSNVPAKFNWCAYASDYPPNVTANNGSYTFHGTLPFTLIAANGTTTQTISTKTVATSAVTITPITLTDQTGCPGVFCIYTGSDLYIDATHLCQQRTAGAKNWEAYVKDTRDNQIYRIIQFSTGTWWFGDDLNVNSNVVGTCSGAKYYNGNAKPACPTGWRIPTYSEIINRAITASDSWGDSATLRIFWHSGNNNCDGLNRTRLVLIMSDCTNSYNIVGDGAGAWNYWPKVNSQSCNGCTFAGRVRCVR